MEKFVRHERPFLFAPEGVVFYLSWESPFNVAYLNSIYPDFLYKQNERNAAILYPITYLPPSASEIHNHIVYFVLHKRAGLCNKNANITEETS